MEEIVNTEIKLHKEFKSLNAIGFDMDMCIVRYNNEATGILIYGCIMEHLITVFPYLKDSKADFTFCKRGLVIDLELGLILKLDNKKQVIKAYRGNNIVEKSEIDSIYHNQSIPNGNPLKDYTGSNCARFFTMISFFETPVTCIFKDFMQYLVNESKTTGNQIDLSRVKQLAKEIIVAFGKHFNDFTSGLYYGAFKKDPGQFIYKADEKFKTWIQDIRSKGTKVLLITNSKSEYCHSVMEYSFGEDFKNYFDCIIVDAKKPEFFKSSMIDKPFFKQLTYFPKEKSEYLTCDNIELNTTETECYKGGNIHLVLNKLKQSLNNQEDISFCYVGDNVIGDVVAPKQVKLMTVAIIEEIQDPEEIIILKREKNTREVKVDKDGLVEASNGKSNYEWGSFFHVHDNHTNISIDTFWTGILRDNADIVVYSVDTLAEYYYADKFDNKDTLSPCAVVYGQGF